MSTINQRIRRSLALATAVTALAVPAAWAAPVDPVVPGEAGDEVQNASYPSVDPSLLVVPSTPTSAPETTTGDGFDWGDAGIGAGAIIGISAMAAGAAVAVRHRPRRGHRVA